MKLTAIIVAGAVTFTLFAYGSVKVAFAALIILGLAVGVPIWLDARR